MSAEEMEEALRELDDKEPPNRGAPPPGKELAWRKPNPLPSGLRPVAPFNMDFLPANFAPWIEDTTERMQCPVEFVAIPAVTALASVIGHKIAIRPQRNTDWEEVPN